MLAERIGSAATLEGSSAIRCISRSWENILRRNADTSFQIFDILTGRLINDSCR